MCPRHLPAFCICLLFAACSGQAPESSPAPAPSPPQPPALPEPERPADFRCTSEPAIPLHPASGSVERIRVDDRPPGIVAWQSGNSLYSVPTHAEQPPSPTAYDLDLANEELLMAARIATGSLLVTTAQCVTDAISHPCLTGYYLADGSQSISRARVGLPARPINGKRTRSPAGVYFAHAYDGAQITLTSFTVREGGVLQSAQRPLGQEIQPTEEPVEVLAITARDDRWVTLWRFGAEESPTGEVVLSLAESESPAPLLRHAISIDTMLWRRASIMIVAGFEFARPALFRIATNGRIRWLPRAIPHEGHLPEPYHQRYNARLIPSQAGARLEVTSAAGDPLATTGPFGGRWTLDNRLVTTSRNDNGFAVAYISSAEERHQVLLARVQCTLTEP